MDPFLGYDFMAQKRLFARPSSAVPYSEFSLVPHEWETSQENRWREHYMLSQLGIEKSDEEEEQEERQRKQQVLEKLRKEIDQQTQELYHRQRGNVFQLIPQYQSQSSEEEKPSFQTPQFSMGHTDQSRPHRLDRPRRTVLPDDPALVGLSLSARTPGMIFPGYYGQYKVQTIIPTVVPHQSQIVKSLHSFSRQ